jgi:homoserine kinase
MRGIELNLPASSANLGPAFDSAAIALDLYLRVRAEAATSFSVQAGGRDAAVCGKLEQNLVLESYREVLSRTKARCVPLALQVNNEIPVGKGCGSSAAARLAGVALAVHFGDLTWTDEQILEEAVRQEGHADNVAACWLGGFVIVHGSGSRQSSGVGRQEHARGDNDHTKVKHATRLEVARDWPLLLVMSSNGLATGKSRALVPTLYGREVVVANLQSAMALVAAYVSGREELFSTAQHDALHQPYRAKVCPLLPCLQPLAGKAGILAVTLSGAGSSVLLTLRHEASQSEVCQAVSERLRAMQLEGELVFTRMAAEGTRRTLLPARALAGEEA